VADHGIDLSNIEYEKEKEVNKKLGITFMLIAAMAFSFALVAQPVLAANDLVIADFDTGDKPNNLGGDFGSWDKDPNDETQGAELAFVEDDALGDKLGYALQLRYDVDSPNPAYNGMWMKLNGVDATKYNTLSFYVRGDAEAGFTQRVKIEMKDSGNKPAAYIIRGITNEWQRVDIPLSKFRRIQDWRALNELVFVFDDINSNPKTGSIYIDQVAFSVQ